MRSVICTSLIVLFSALGAEAATLRAELSPPSTPFHRPAILTLIVEAPEGVAVNFPELSQEAFTSLEITRKRGEQTEIAEGVRRTSQSYQLDPQDVGIHLLPALEVELGDGEVLRAPPLLLEARPLNEAEEAAAMEFADITTVSALMRDQRPMPWGVIGLVGGIFAVLLAVGAWLLYRYSKPTTAPPPPPAWEVAFRRLEELRARNLTAQGEYQRYYIDLTAILRFYIEDRYQIHAPELTTPEFLDAVSRNDLFSEGHQEMLGDFLRHADHVKFAQYRPTEEEMSQSFQAVERFVQETQPPPETAETQKEAAA